MLDLVIVFIYTSKNETTTINLNSIIKNNKGIKVIDICQDDFKNDYHKFLDLRPLKYWDGGEIWYWGSDNIFLYWYLSNNSIKAKNYIIFEWDTYCHNVSVVDFFSNESLFKNEGIYCPLLATQEKDPWYYWFNQQKENMFIRTLYKYENFKCCTPLCGTIISDKCVNSIIDHLKEHNFINKMYVETKFATIASYLGFPVIGFNKDMRKYISHDKNIVDLNLKTLTKNKMSLNGIFHPIKDKETIERYFMNDKIQDIPTDKIHKAFYGILVDVKDVLEQLRAINPKEKIQVNNFLNGDPAHGLEKELYLTYEKNGQIFETVIPEKSFIDFENM